VFPDAEVKLFLTASAETRAERRVNDLQERGIAAKHDDILHQIETRDRQDSERAVAPLRPADDAILLDSTHMDLDAVVARVLAIVESAESRASS
jgi:cytidylate kinase